ncbi:hypothetical protein SLEP1_g7084 [Rubroshorea leprosula]|uniref:Uncharacterized protein n=1 Tax=Rubroshorea leprosula TaxID=152421 RepID=A0AAV5I3J4_9ROSI|nr:hypothetical protein SLEP1_g7084 [Rubroshorea leprosula]
MRLAKKNFKTVDANEIVDLKQTSPGDSSTFVEAKSSTVDKLFGQEGENAFEEETVALPPTVEEIQVATLLEVQMSELKTRISSKQKALADMNTRRKQLLDGLHSQLKKLEPKRVVAEALAKKNQGITKELTAMQLEWKEWRDFL